MIDLKALPAQSLYKDIDFFCLPRLGMLEYTYDMESLSKLEPITLNIRLLLWRKHPKPETWADALHSKTNIDKNLAVEILRGLRRPSAEEASLISAAFLRTEEDLRNAPLLGMSQEDVLQENIKFLLAHLPRGEKKAIAEKLSVVPETISRWTSRKSPPTKANRTALMRYMGLDPSLIEQPIFLSMEPISDLGKKKWLSERVERISPDELSSLFPALRKLLDDYEGD